MTENSQKLNSNIPFRVRVGVIGAETLTDTKQLANQIKRVFPDEICKLYDENSQKKLRQTVRTKLAFSVLTTLGSEAERIAASEILKAPGGKIEVVLPCPKNAFLREFVESSSHHEFEELFNRARRPIALQKHFTFSRLTKAAKLEKKAEMTLETRRYIVNRSDVLLVIRDEKPDDENIQNIIEVAEKKRRPVILIGPDGISIKSGHGLNAAAITGLEAFNTFPVDPGVEAEYIESVFQSLFTGAAGVDETSKELVRDILLPFYVRASVIAKKNQKIYQNAGLFVYVFSAAAVAAVALGTLIHKLSPWAFGLEFLLLLTILVTVVWADRHRTHRQWIENRFLAERLRAAQFLATCRTEVTPIRVPPYLKTRGQRDDWTLMAFNEIWDDLPALKGCHTHEIEQLKEFIRVHWLEGQINYHQTKTQKAWRISHLLEKSGFVVFGCALAAAALHLVFYLLHQEWLEIPLTFAAIVLPAVGASIGGIRTHREYSRIAKRSENMAQNLTQIKENLADLSGSDEFETFLREVEEIMLVETQDWLMMMNFAKLETAA